MDKQELLAIKKLRATAKMMQSAAMDAPKEEMSAWGNKYKLYEYGIYMRCVVQNEILKAAFFFPDFMRAGGKTPVYEVYCSKKEESFLLYDCIAKKWRTAKLDRIDWPSYCYYSSEKWISAKDTAIVKNYFESSCESYYNILDFQCKVRARELEERHKKETDPWDKDLERVPPLPKDWRNWVDKVGITENYLFYHYTKGGAKKGYCSFCGKEVPIIKHPYHNAEGKCPRCRHTVITKAIGRAGYFKTASNYVYLIQRCREGVVIREFTAERIYHKDEYTAPNIYVQEVRRALYDSNLHPRAYYWGLYKQCEHRWISCSPCSPTYSHSQKGRIYGKTLPSLAKDELKRTGLVQWAADKTMVDPEKYLAIWGEVPHFEKIWKAGLTKLTEECIGNAISFGKKFLNPMEPKLIKAIGLDSQGFKRLRLHNGDSRFLEWLQYEKKTHHPISDELIQWFCSENIKISELDFISQKMNTVQIRNYIQKQMPYFSFRSRDVVGAWKDYLSMAKKLHMNTDDSIIYRVNKLRQRHDELVKKCQEKAVELQIEEILKNYPHIDKICKSLKEKYEYANESYAVVAPNGVEDIIMEGKALNHCVGSSEHYWDRIERKESFILFLRKRRKQKEHYYTLEIEPDGTIRQKRTEYDRQNPDIEKATKFLAEWQKVISQRLTNSDRTLAKQSRVLRLEGFKELREQQVVIHTGQLRGQLLVDVLMADLMENTENASVPALPDAA